MSMQAVNARIGYLTSEFTITFARSLPLCATST
jgi:hypothetical protein